MRPEVVHGSVRAVRRAAIAMLVALAAGAPAVAATHTVTIVGMVFDPATVHAAPGDRIVWLNRDLVPHTASALDRSFESGRIDPGEQWSLVVTAAGAVDYRCAYHPTMQGRMEVR
ncbi:MAG TPA: cupredoxin family copper-binding protein [Steroidobacteraceae bacterium]|nr:cupredoxin family copper-binding protein [Steroidobacteraceae bacterium]